MNNSILDINKILNEYSNDIQEAIVHQADLVSKLGVNKLQSNSPKRTGKYSKGWKVKSKVGNGFVNNTIYNKNPGLTHLLEKPHVIKNQYGEWGTSKPKVHIYPVEQFVIKDFENAVKRVIQSGGN